jgi:microcystin-dependent protein
MSEIKIVSFNFAPKGWAMCNGQLLPINQNQALFSLLGTTYGGNGVTNFALPDMRGRTPAHIGGGLTQGEILGQESVTLNITQVPAHIHVLAGSSSGGNKQNPNFGGTGYLLASDPGNCYAPSLTGGAVALGAASVSNVGGNQPHENRGPSLVLNFCIALQGIFPSRN